MSAIPDVQNEIITSKKQLVDYLASGCKPKKDWRVGTEHEKFLFHHSTYKPLNYQEKGGIRDILLALTKFGWKVSEEMGQPIALHRGKAAITLEPGGQFELSGAPLENLHQTQEEFAEHFAELKKIQDVYNFGILPLGFQPKWPRADIPLMPKARYQIMHEYMPKKGSLGVDMMLRTCTVQANLDFSSEADMVKKFRVSMALQSLVTALFANSPFTDGKPNGFESYRSHIWNNTDPDRSGILNFAFDADMSFEKYVDYILTVPMYFVYREGRYINAAGQSFEDLIKGKLKALPGEYATLGDWINHLGVAFPEVRLKRYLEMRGADGVQVKALPALPALWVGLLYDEQVLNEAESWIKKWKIADIQQLRLDVPKLGLKALLGKQPVLELCKSMVQLSLEGLRRRNIKNKQGQDETIYLDFLQEVIKSGKNPAQRMLEQDLQGKLPDMDYIFQHYGI